MNKKILKWYLNYIDSKRLNEIFIRADISIKGFTPSKKNKKKPPMPTQFLIKNMLEKENYNKVTEYLLGETSLDIEEELKEKGTMEVFNEIKSREEILKFLVGSDEDEYLEEKEFIINEIKNGTLVLEVNKNNLECNEVSVAKDENSKSNCSNLEENDIKKLKRQILKLERSNEKLDNEVEKIKEQKKVLTNEKSSLNKQINVLNQERTTLKRKLIASESKETKSIENYNNLKNKYDELIKREKGLEKENEELIKESKKIKKREESLKVKNKELNNELETINKMLEKVSKAKIAIIGDIEKIHLKGSNYEFEKIELKDVSNLEELLEDYEEVWVLLYELQSLEQSRVLRKENKYKIFKFKTFEEVKNHMNCGR